MVPINTHLRLLHDHADWIQFFTYFKHIYANNKQILYSKYTTEHNNYLYCILDRSNPLHYTGV